MAIPSLPISILFFLFVLPLSHSIYFQIPHFDANDTTILYKEDAVPSAGKIELVNKTDYSCRVGWATYAERVPLRDYNTRKLTDLTTHFKFIVDTEGVPYASYGNGLAFFLASVGIQIPPNSAGGFLGPFNTTTMAFSWNQIALVELDSCANLEWDPRYEHVGINNNSIASAVNTSWNASFHSGDIADLGDFELAQLMDHELGPQTIGLVGTLGYLAPEYIITGRASKASDIYSFGVVASGIATGKKAMDFIGKDSELGLVEWVWDLYGQ